MAKTQEDLGSKRQSRQVLKIIDCDIHPDMRSFDEVVEYLSDSWKDFVRAGRVKRIGGQPMVVPVDGGMRMDSYPPEGGPAGSSPEFMKKQLLDEHNMEHAILYPHSGYQIASLPQDGYATALASAVNDWLIDKWLSYDSRFKGSLMVAAQDPQAAAAEIDRLGKHPQVVQVGLGIHTPYRGYGDKFYDPIWEAAVRNNLVITFHVSLASGLYAAHQTGYPKSFPESQTLNGLTYQAQLASMVFNGVFEKFPNLKVTFIEGGFAWVPHMMYTMDTHWRAVRREVPWVKRPPSEYVREHCWFGTQPMIKAEPKYLNQIIEMIGADRLLYASDYPHWEFDNPETVYNGLSKELKEKIFYENPKKLYGFNDTE